MGTTIITGCRLRPFDTLKTILKKSFLGLNFLLKSTQIDVKNYYLDLKSFFMALTSISKEAENSLHQKGECNLKILKMSSVAKTEER